MESSSAYAGRINIQRPEPAH